MHQNNNDLTNEVSCSLPQTKSGMNNFSKYSRLLLNGLANIKAGDNLERHQLHQNSIQYYLKGLDYTFEFYSKQNRELKSTIIQINNIKEFIQFYYIKAKEIDKKLNDTCKLVKIDDIMKELRLELSVKRQSIPTHVSEKFDRNNVDSIDSKIELIGYEDVKKYIFHDIFNETQLFNFTSKVIKCRPFIIYGLPGMGKVSFVNSISINYEQKLGFNLFKIDFEEPLDFDKYFQNILFTLRNSKQKNIVLLLNLEFIKKLNQNLHFILIEKFLCGIDSLNGYETVIIGVTCIPWSLPFYLRCRFYKRFHIKLPIYEEIKLLLIAKLKLKSPRFLHIFNSFVKNKLLDVYYEIASCVQNCTFKIVDEVFDVFVSELNKNQERLISEQKSEDEKLNNTSKKFVMIRNNSLISSSPLHERITSLNLNVEVLKELIQENVANKVKLNQIPDDIILKYQLFSKKYDNEVESTEL